MQKQIFLPIRSTYCRGSLGGNMAIKQSHEICMNYIKYRCSQRKHCKHLITLTGVNQRHGKCTAMQMSLCLLYKSQGSGQSWTRIFLLSLLYFHLVHMVLFIPSYLICDKNFSGNWKMCFMYDHN